MNKLTASDIIQRYSEGQRDFFQTELTGGDLSGVNLRDCIFVKSNFTDTSFENSDLTNANFSDCNLQRCIFRSAILKNTRFISADLSWANLRECVIEDTNFKSANLMWAHLCKNDLALANIEDARISWSCLADSRMSVEQMMRVSGDTTVKSEHGNYGSNSIIGPSGKASYSEGKSGLYSEGKGGDEHDEGPRSIYAASKEGGDYGGRNSEETKVDIKKLKR